MIIVVDATEVKQREEYCWDEFAKYADEVGISIRAKEDYESWWETWCNGIEAYKKKIYPGLYSVESPESVGEVTDPGHGSECRDEGTVNQTNQGK